MKPKLFKRSVALILSVMMIFGFVPWETVPFGLFSVRAEDETATIATDYEVGATVTNKGNNAEPTGTIPTGSHWEGPVESTGTTCGKDEHKHTDACYSVSTIASCDHASDQLLSGAHPNKTCLSNPKKVSGLGAVKCTGGWCGYKYHWWDGTTPYHSNDLSSSCGHENGHNSSCYATYQSCTKSEHTHTEPDCYDYTWTLKWDTHKVTWTWKDADNKDATKVEENVKYGTALTAPEVPETIVVGATTYTFKGWDSQDAGNEPDTNLKVTGDMTYTAVYSSETLYSVTFNTDGGSNVNAQKIEKDKTATKPENPTKAGFMFVKWVDANGNEFDFATKITADVALKAVWASDTNNNGINDETETIKVIINENGEVKLTDGNNNVINATNVTAVYDSTSGKVTVVATPASGYYVDVTVNNGAVLTGSYENKDILTGLETLYKDDYRNVYTGSFTVEPGKSYEVTVVNTKEEFSIPVRDLELEVNGSYFDSLLDATQKGNAVSKVVLTALYGENYESNKYECDFGLIGSGAWGIKLNEQFSIKVVEKGDAKHPDVSATFKVTLTDNRTAAEITHDYVNGSSFNTEDDFKKAFVEAVLFNGTAADFEGWTSLGKNGEISWTKNDDGTYTASVKALSAEG